MSYLSQGVTQIVCEITAQPQVEKAAAMSDLPVVKSSTQSSPYSQIGMGAAGGFLTGFVLLKASKMVAVAAGGTILAIELAWQAGFVRLDVVKTLSQLEQDQPRVQQLPVREMSLERVNLNRVQELGDKARKACATSGRLCVAFLGGFLLGFGWA
ncbi:FUN14 domain-containing protein 2 isoform X3 [Drosophila santomea]|uniref:FUN14 domain-containing protein 2 isoform X3 n=1 Tax=Drosophila santomea TaxID=129105 RepID=UPI001CCE7D89|nr:FUN14 domain-containing protein 2 isoform X3 [Drosophila santomea]